MYVCMYMYVWCWFPYCTCTSPNSMRQPSTALYHIGTIQWIGGSEKLSFQQVQLLWRASYEPSIRYCWVALMVLIPSREPALSLKDHLQKVFLVVSLLFLFSFCSLLGFSSSLCPCFFLVSLVISISFMFCWASQHYAESPCYWQSCERISVCWLHWPPPTARNWWINWVCCDRCSLTYKLL